ncbi:MAG: IPT/TIG domain-containing protein, partial [Acidimicrobiales bacterium]
MTFTQLAQAYGMSGLYGQGRAGDGITVALYELEPFRSSDVAAFQQCYGVANPLRTVAVDGGAGSGPGSGEAALDIEEVSAMAPGAGLVVYEGPNRTTSGPVDTFDRIATDDAAQVVSTSWGQCEPQNTPTRGGNAPVENEIFAEMAAQGQTVVAASGDSGSEDCWQATATYRDTDTQLAVDDPASQPYVTGVGGTDLPSTTPSSQTMWNDCENAGTACAKSANAGASGGGISAVWAMPSWQQGVAGPSSSGTPCGAPAGTSCREVPDVASDADPDTGVPVYWDGHWLVVGGTSAGAPLWGSLAALADQGCAATVGFANPALYALGAAGSGAFTDVTSGQNDLTNTHGGLYPAGAGYDMASGWGTPDGGPLLGGLQPAGGCPSVSSLSSPGGPVTGGGTLTVYGAGLSGATAVDVGTGRPATIVSDSATAVTVAVPASGYSTVAFVTVTTANGTSAPSATSRYVYGTPRTGLGYWESAADGGIFAYGNAGFHGSMGGQPLNAPVVGMAATPDDGGYWEVASDGGLFAFGDAAFYGSMGGHPLNAPVVGIATTADGRGYWEVASDGGLFAFGDAPFYGSMGGRALNRPIVGIAPTPDGRGYWEVASDGGLFAFGDAQFYGSMG